MTATDTSFSNTIDAFLTPYGEQVLTNALKVREIILNNLPEVQEQMDISAKMIAYCYGNKYTEMVCTLIPSQKGLKLGFYKGVELPDPEKVLKGNGKLSRYIEIKTENDIKANVFTALLKEALMAYKIRNNRLL